jgi:gp16 family phage-associated protein
MLTILTLNLEVRGKMNENKEKLNELKFKFWEMGLTIKKWSEQNGFAANRVYRVLNGLDKGRYGEAFKIKKALEKI